LREKYLDDGRKVAQRLMKDAEVLAIWLSGPLEVPRISPTSDLHMAVLIRNGRESFYHHVLPAFSEVGRRSEIAFFPLEFLQSAFEKDYKEWATLFDLHKLKEIVILYERDGILSGLRDKLSELRPGRLFVGKQIEALKSELILTYRLLDEYKYVESVLTSRQVLWQTLQLLMPIGKGVTFSKLSELYPMLKSHLPSFLIEGFELVQTVRGVSEATAGERVEKTRDLVRSLFERQAK
jgi:hypothetical protein